jgi:hypothetical protein
MDERAARERVAHEPARVTSPTRRTVTRRVVPRVADDSPVVGVGGGVLDHATSSRIRASTGRGEPLDPLTRSQMEPLFGTDLAAVRIHRNDAEAPRLMAKAYTVGTDVHFAARQYQPATRSGQQLLAHELAHVVQQSGATVGRYIDTEVALTALREARDAQARAQAFTNQITATKNVIGARLGNDANKKKEVNDRLKDANRRFTDAIKDPYDPATGTAAARELIDALNTIERELIDTTVAAPANQILQQNQARHDRTIEALTTFGQGTRATALTQARTTAATSIGAPVYVETNATRDLDAYLDLLTAEEKAVAPQHLMKIGTEFTFTSSELEPLDIVAGGEPIATASGLIERWAGLLKNLPIIVKNPLPAPTPVPEPFNFAKERDSEGHKDAPSQTAIKFVYTLPSGGQWWWRANIDYACIECQTDPITASLMVSSIGDDPAAIYQIISSHIFSVATDSLGLKPHAEIGGGHLTLDRMTTFADNARWFRNFLVLYANDPTAARRDADKFNAVLITELTKAGRDEFKKVIGDYDERWKAIHNPPPQQPQPQPQQGKAARQQPKPEWDLKDLVEALKTRVFTAKHLPAPEPDVAEASINKRKAQPAHYQSTNVEHMLVNKAKQNEIDTRRFEMRRFDAQQGIEDLANDLDYLVGLAQASRAPGLIDLRI